MIVVVGLGNIGLAIARRLVVRGNEVLGVEVAEPRRAAWNVLTGQEAVADLADVPWERVDRVFVIVRMTDQAAEVLDHISANASPERDLACHVVTTLEPSFASNLQSWSRPGLRLLEQPVSGGELGAMGGRLTVLVAGPFTDADERFLLGTLAADVVRFDSYGEPTTAKLLNNVTGAYNARALADMLLLGQEQGIDPKKLYRVLLTSSGGSWMAGGFLELLDDMLAKDVVLLRDDLGTLPQVTLEDGPAFVARLQQARALLNDA